MGGWREVLCLLGDFIYVLLLWFCRILLLMFGWFLFLEVLYVVW